MLGSQPGVQIGHLDPHPQTAGIYGTQGRVDGRRRDCRPTSRWPIASASCTTGWSRSWNASIPRKASSVAPSAARRSTSWTPARWRRRGSTSTRPSALLPRARAPRADRHRRTRRSAPQGGWRLARRARGRPRAVVPSFVVRRASLNWQGSGLEIHRAARPLGVRIPRPPPLFQRPSARYGTRVWASAAVSLPRGWPTWPMRRGAGARPSPRARPPRTP